jgi:hypothetical protein
LKREKVGAWGAAKELLYKRKKVLLNKRKNEIREGIKMPENMRQTSPRFKTFCDDILVYSKKHHRDFRSVEIRVRKIVADFGETPVPAHPLGGIINQLRRNDPRPCERPL